MEAQDVIGIIIGWSFVLACTYFWWKGRETRKIEKLLYTSGEIFDRLKPSNLPGDYCIKISNDDRTRHLQVYVLLVALFKVSVEEASEIILKIEAEGFSLLGELSEESAKDYSNFIEAYKLKCNCMSLKHEIVKRE